MAGGEQMLPEIRSFNPVEAAMGVVVRPVAAMRQIAAARPWPIALAVYVAMALLGALVSLTTPWAELGPDEPSPELPGGFGSMEAFTPWLAVVSALVFGPAMLFLLTGVFYLVGRLFGGRGRFSALLATQAFAVVPNILLLPVLAIVNLSGAQVAVVLMAPLSLGFWIWTLALQALGIRESLGLSTGRAVATLLIPIAVAILLVCGAAALIIALALAALGAQPGE